MCLAGSSSSAYPELKNGIMRVKTLRDSLSSCSSSSSDGTTTTQSQDDFLSRSVRFNEVQIREYAVTIGDHPSCSSGTPVSLDWMYATSDLRVDVEQYEEYREPNRRDKDEMRMPSMVRLDLLMNTWDYSLRAIMNANCEMNIIRDQRKKARMKARRSKRQEESRSTRMEKVKKAFSTTQRSKKEKKTPVKESAEVEIATLQVHLMNMNY